LGLWGTARLQGTLPGKIRGPGRARGGRKENEVSPLREGRKKENGSLEKKGGEEKGTGKKRGQTAIAPNKSGRGGAEGGVPGNPKGKVGKKGENRKIPWGENNSRPQTFSEKNRKKQTNTGGGEREKR